MQSPTILVVDNEREIREIIRLNLLNAEMNVYEADSGATAIEQLEIHSIDLILLDLMMENMSGWDVLEYLASKQIDIAIIIISARQLESDKIETLGLGADDYITKPFSPGELIARIRATLRRIKPYLQTNTITCGDLTYDRESFEIIKSNQTISLSPIEGSMLELFMQAPGRVFTHKEIFQHVWKLDQFDRNSVKVYINYLRKKIGDDPANPRYIQTIRGIGYRLVVKTT